MRWHYLYLFILIIIVVIFIILIVARNFNNRSSDPILSSRVVKLKIISPAGSTSTDDTVTIRTRQILARFTGGASLGGASLRTPCSTSVASIGVFSADESLPVTDTLNGTPPTQHFLIVPAAITNAGSGTASVAQLSTPEEGIFTLQSAVTGNYLRVLDNCNLTNPIYYTVFDYTSPPPPPDQDPNNWFKLTRIGNANNYTFESLGYSGLYLGKVFIQEVPASNPPTTILNALSLSSTVTNFALIE